RSPRPVAPVKRTDPSSLEPSPHSRSGRVTTLLVVVVLAVASLLPPLVAPGWAQDVISQEEPQPESVEEDQTPIDRLLRLEVKRVRPFPWLKEQLKDLPPFLRDTE